MYFIKHLFIVFIVLAFADATNLKHKPNKPHK